MKKIKLICKGLLLYVTAFVTTFWMCGIESIIEQGSFIFWTLAMIALICICCKFISYREFYILSLSKWVHKYYNI